MGVDDAVGTGRDRLGQLVRERRVELGLSLNQAAQLADMNRATWTGIEQRGTAAEDYTYGKIERVLKWAPGSVAAILSGREPSTLAPEAVTADPSTESVDRWEERSIKAIWADDRLSNADKFEYEQKVRRAAADRRSVDALIERIQGPVH